MKVSRTAISLSVSFGLAGLISASLIHAAGQAETADQFVARMNVEMKADYPEITSSQWLASTYINDDSQRVSSKANERALARLGQYVAQSRQHDGKPMSAATARAIQLLRLGITVPPPNDPAHLAEITQIGARMEGMYGAGKFCADANNPDSCMDIGQAEDVLAATHTSSYDQQLKAWEGWHTISIPMRADYQRFAALSNEGARDLGFANTGVLWRGGYDMAPEAFQAETDRLWGQVKPLYEQLQCFTRNRLVEKYGAEKGQVNGMIPAHLAGNLWQQNWGNLWPLLVPYKDTPKLDISQALQAQRDGRYQELLAAFEKKNGHPASAAEAVEMGRDADLAQAKAMVRQAEGFYVSLGMPKLPASFWDTAQFIKPRDRDVVCHASAWDMDLVGDVRIKMCIKPAEDSFTTIYHELGHVYYYLSYNKLAPIFQSGANDGFHEAIGDTVVLSMTPEYLNSIGLVDKPTVSQEATINAQMRQALAKVAFLPFGLMIDRWRWGVFDGSITPDHYNQAWWALKAKYQGVAPVTPRGEQFFDPGAKYHVPGNTPYTRYFLANILQFQFYKSLCDASGYQGPLNQCSFANNAEAGKRYWAMLQKGSSQPWPQTLKQLTGNEQLDGSAVLEYFAPLQVWLKKQNEGKTCGWAIEGA